MHPDHIPSSQKGKPWPAYFIVRTTGEVVPLIAVDELPVGTDIIGVPRKIDLENTIGMLNLGLQRSSGACYQLLHPQELKNQAAGVSKVVVYVPAPEVSAKASIDKAAQLTSRSKQTAIPSPPTTPARNHEQPPPPAPPPPPTTATTTLCRHWCHHGICKWGQQCRYRHIMPMSNSGLQEVGLSDWPAWFRRMNPGYFAAENPDLSRGAAGNDRAPRSRRPPPPGAKVCGSLGGNGGACCGVLHGPGGGRERMRPRERERERERVGGRDRVQRGGGRVVKGEELGEQIIARLRSVAAREDQGKGAAVVEKERKKKELSSCALVERAAARDTRGWEEESEESGDEDGQSAAGEEEKGGKVARTGKLVDV
ncbi:zinc finger DNA-binding protein [Drepanopeziza brunnea f. sp. 'multigermtubi' MB_m1]|uniref:Zinc finger DNA-binding protein n=1 Tax=Marssonina brunnea f. sp. multigermtubi (strain MB_m1) TaxID=1072389 RepID=K1WJZ7_MARBU|nr:zinc finger DNA-binding protein [Drepanopeziza brunnea f. sp. 'multigermtubi' MB_m1]EKD13141.1 zinc finger DNA-binding protein [Drepanopeziza brunnea f. sp. 'multigermtubi' MB_m1]